MILDGNVAAGVSRWCRGACTSTTGSRRRLHYRQQTTFSPARQRCVSMDDHEFLQQFEACSLPKEAWTHRAHLKVAYLYLTQHPFEQAADKVRSGIKAYNAAIKVVEGPMTGYNETTTMAFLHLVGAIIAAYGEYYPTATADEFCDRHPQLLSKHILRFFYSPQQRMHPDAKTSFVEPDLTPLPKIGTLGPWQQN